MNREKTYNLVLGAIFTALIIIISFTPIGYLRIGILSISFITIFVSIGGILLGPLWGAFFGLLFGLTSFAQCFMGDALGAALVSVSIPLTFLTCVGPRILVGLLSSLAFRAVAKIDKSKIGAVITASVAAPVVNTLTFIPCLYLCFRNAKTFQEMMGVNENVNIFAVVIASITLNVIVEWVCCTVISAIIAKSLLVVMKKSRLKNFS